MIEEAAAAGAGELMDRLPRCDFYRNPTLLSRLILNQKYQVAASRLKRHPEEARVVVVARRRQAASPSPPSPSSAPPAVATYLRQLPIHVACLELGRAVDPALRGALNQLVAHLAVTFPEACACPDHSGTYPIQYAVRHGAEPSTVSLLLMAVPESLLYVTGATSTRHGRSLAQLNQASGSPHRKRVAQVLKLDVDFWRQSREEANFRLQEQQQQLQQQRQQEPTLNPHGPAAPAEGAIEPLRDESVAPVAWSQLEVRAIALEQILGEMNERNYALARRIEALTKTKMDLLDHLDRIKQSALAKEARRLQRQNRALQKQMGEMEQLLRRSQAPPGAGPPPGGRPRGDEAKEEIAPPHGSPYTGASSPPPRQLGSRRGSESSSLVGHSPYSGGEPPEAMSAASVSTRGIQTRSLQADNLRLIQENHELRHKYELLNGAYRSQQTRLNRLVSLIRRLSRDAAALLLEAGVGVQRGGGADSRHSLSESPLTLSEESSLSGGGGGGGGRGAPPPPPPKGRPGPVPERQPSQTALPRRRRTIEIQWHSASTGLAQPPSSFRSRGGPHARGEGEEKVDDDDDDDDDDYYEDDAVRELSDNLSVLFAQAIEHEDENLPLLPAPAPGARVVSRRRLSLENIPGEPQRQSPPPSPRYPEPPSPTPAHPPQPMLQPPSPPSSPARRRRRRQQQQQQSGATAAATTLDDLQIPALLGVPAGRGEAGRAGEAASATPPTSI
jgi:hypothetical protein